MGQGPAAEQPHIAMLEALAFLTVVRVGADRRPPGRASLLAFPVVGLALGAVWSLAAWGAAGLWGPLVAAAAVSIVDLGLTGGLHLDAVADLADGWASRRPADEAREIMRDPAVGAVGAAVLGVAQLSRFALLALAATEAASGAATGIRWWWLVVPPVAGRAAMVWVLGRSRDPGPDAPQSLTSALSPVGWRIVAGAVGVALVLAGAAAGLRGLGAVAAGMLLAEGGRAWSQERFGCLAGDTVGAVGIAVEILALAVLTARL